MQLWQNKQTKGHIFRQQIQFYEKNKKFGPIFVLTYLLSTSFKCKNQKNKTIYHELQTF